MGGFEVVSLSFQMDEEPLDPPAHLVEFEGFLFLKTVADNEEVGGASTLFDSLAGKEKLQSKAALQTGWFPPPWSVPGGFYFSALVRAWGERE